MKKLLWILVCFALCAFLCACGKGAAGNTVGVSQTFEQTEVGATETEAPEAEEPAAETAAPAVNTPKAEAVTVSDAGDNYVAFDEPADGSSQGGTESATSGNSSAAAEQDETPGETDVEVSAWSNYY